MKIGGALVGKKDSVEEGFTFLKMPIVQPLTFIKADLHCIMLLI